MKRTVSFVLYVAQKATNVSISFFKKTYIGESGITAIAGRNIFPPILLEKNTKSAYPWLISFAFDPIFVPDALDHGRISQNSRCNLFFYIEM